MSNKTVLKKEVTGTPGVNMIDKSKKENPTPDKVTKKIKKPLKKSSVLQIDAAERGAVGAVNANSSRTMRASSDIANTGTIISYD
ncbi:MAG TPA: hypothetical protein VIJ75_17945 [Hanamia sp.]